MSDKVYAVEKYKTGDVTDDACTTDYNEIASLDRTSDNHCKPEFIYGAVEVKPEDLQDVKEETVGESDTEDAHYSVKQEPAVDDDNTFILDWLIKVRF